ncbi:hypothetical protein K6Q96_06925 [Grimontia kaedaensis]|uniref:Uncharacterized protein n=1 Tax=Grimontia kaedaensis TaxID=2872157 RepID=A0ABY4WXJ9_9GAMM|nr:DUF6682 family protein [Grimontia kaedaensis]USH03720.1 hypothetical protein K6Q96_06925 [Grimontia kaedaensis]
MKISDVVDRLGSDLVDKDYVHWSREELLAYINDGLSEMALNLPSQFRVVATVQTDTGEITLPPEGIKVLSVQHVEGRPVNYVEMTKLNQLDAAWRGRVGQPSSWTQEEDEQRSYSLYPRPTAMMSVTHAYSAFTPLQEDDALPIHSVYLSAVVDYAMYRAYGKDGQNASEQNKSINHYQIFNAAIGREVNVKHRHKLEREQRENKR